MDLLDHRASSRGFFSRAEALDSGLRDADLAAGRRDGSLARVRHGYYAPGPAWRALDGVGKHLLLADTWTHQMDEGAVALSHLTGALAHGLDVWGLPLDTVHVTRLDGGTGRRARGIVHHLGRTREEEVSEDGGRLVLPPARCALEAATLGDAESALVVLDSLKHRRLATDEEVHRQFLAMARWPRTRKLHVVVRMSDGRAESVGESRLRWRLRCAGMPAPVLQYEVRDHGGDVVAVCDLAWPGLGIVVEFDGLAKYGRLLAPGTTPAEALVAEKRREDLVRELTGFTVIRVVWADLADPARLRARIDRAVAARRALA